jgi:SAM-dependent methyltransferase/chorismate mutase
MEKILDLKDLGHRLATVDVMIIQLIARRMGLAEQVGKYKRKNGDMIFRGDIEDKRIEEIRKISVSLGINPHFAESILYMLINESCKLQMIQLQEEILNTEHPQNDNQWHKKLKQNLLVLAEQWCLTYDIDYENSYFATQEYLLYEQELLSGEIQQLSDTKLMLDLGCATGRMSFNNHSEFTSVVGFDISQHMRSRANHLAEKKNLHSKIIFECSDLEDGIPTPDESTSFVVMNLGTASDIRDIGKVIKETVRVLKPGGRFFFSFYNRDALVYRWDFLPWQAGLAASINIHSDSLDVHSKDTDLKEKIISVFARAYSCAEVLSLFADRGLEVSPIVTYPTISAILPRELFVDQPEIQKSITAIDRTLIDASMGAYIVVRGKKSL